MYKSQITFKEKKDKLVKWVGESFQLSPIDAQVCATGAVVVLLGTLLLLALNWDAKGLAILLSLSLCGAVTSFSSALSLLKGEIIEESCRISVPFDTPSNNLPNFAMIIPQDGSNNTVISRYTEIANIGLSKPISKKMKKPKDPRKALQMHNEVASHFCGELLQYYILKTVYLIQRKMLHLMRVGEEEKLDIKEENAKNDTQLVAEKIAIPKSILLSKTSVCPGERLWDLASGNRFSQLKSEQIFWQSGHFLLPDNTTASLNYVTSSPIPGKEGYNVRLLKPMYFDIGITIIPIATTSMGVLPPGIDLPDELAATIRTFRYVVQMTAKFDKLTSGNSQTDELKGWTRWLFRQLKKTLADAPEIDIEMPAPLIKPAESVEEITTEPLETADPAQVASNQT